MHLPQLVAAISFVYGCLPLLPQTHHHLSICDDRTHFLSTRSSLYGLTFPHPSTDVIKSLNDTRSCHPLPARSKPYVLYIATLLVVLAVIAAPRSRSAGKKALRARTRVLLWIHTSGALRRGYRHFRFRPATCHPAIARMCCSTDLFFLPAPGARWSVATSISQTHPARDLLAAVL